MRLIPNRVLIAACLAGLVGLSALAQQNPPLLATQARVDITARANVGSLQQGRFVESSGSIGRMNWLPEAQQSLTYTVQAPVDHFSWRAFTIRLVPENSGVVELALLGPWQQSPQGPIYKQEILWDGLEGGGVTIRNPGFEQATGGNPSFWVAADSQPHLLAGPPEPVEGLRHASSWHDGRLTQLVAVSAGVEVTLRFHVRAALPDDFVDMRRIEGSNSPAHQALKRFLRGANLGNYLEAPKGQNWGATYSQADFAAMKSEGFDHVRIPVAWHHYAGPAPGYLLEPGIFTKVDFLVTNALARGLSAIVNIHHFDEFTSAPAATQPKFLALWRQIAARYANQPEGLAFELLNEPKDAATTETLNPIYAAAIRAIRESNPSRVLFVGPGNFNSLDQLGALKLPDDDENLIVTVHSYEPFLFTHQGADWTLPATATEGVVYPGPPATPLKAAPQAAGQSWVVDWIRNYNTLPRDQNSSGPAAFATRLERAADWSRYYGRPLHVGEFGCYIKADSASRRRFHEDMRSRMERLGMGWALWDWKAGFRYWEGNKPAPGMREALFPGPKLEALGPGKISIDFSSGKTIRLERISHLAPKPAWVEVFHQALEQPNFVFEEAARLNSAFYRAEWLK